MQLQIKRIGVRGKNRKKNIMETVKAKKMSLGTH